MDKNGEKYKRLAWNSVLFAIGNFGSKLISFVMLPLYTSYLNKSEFGVSDLILTTISLLMPLVSMCIYEAMLRFGMDKNYDSDKVLSNTLFIAFFSSIIMLSLIPIVCILDIDFGVYVIFILIVQIFQNIISQYAKAIDKIKVYAINGILLSFFLAGSNIILLAFLHWGIDGYLYSLIIGYALTDLFLFYSLRLWKHFKIQNIDFALIKKFVKYSIPLIPNAIALWLNTASNRYFVLIFLGNTMNGIFAVANKIPTLLGVLNNIFFQSWQISAIEEFDSENKEDFFSDVFNMYAKFMLLCCSAILVFLKFIMAIFTSPDFYTAWKYVPFLLIAIMYSSFSSFLETNYVAAQKTTGVLKTTIYGAIISLILNVVLIPKIGLNGAGISSMISFFCIFLIRFLDTKKFVLIKLDYSSLIFNHTILLFQMFFLYFLSERYGLLNLIIQVILFVLSLLLNRKIWITFLNKILIKFNKI